MNKRRKIRADDLGSSDIFWRFRKSCELTQFYLHFSRAFHAIFGANEEFIDKANIAQSVSLRLREYVPLFRTRLSCEQYIFSLWTRQYEINEEEDKLRQTYCSTSNSAAKTNPFTEATRLTCRIGSSRCIIEMHINNGGWNKASSSSSNEARKKAKSCYILHISLSLTLSPK